MASPVYAATSNGTNTSTSVTFTEPSGASSGEGLLLYLILENGFTGLSGLTGWTQEVAQSVNSEFTAFIYSIRRGASAPNLSLSWTGSKYFDWSMRRITGIVATGNWVESITSTTPGTGTVIDTPSATPLTANTLALSVGWAWAAMDVSGGTPPTGPTGYSNGFRNGAYDQADFWKQLSTTAAEDPDAWQALINSDGIWGNTIIIASQAAGGPTITSQPSDTQVAVGGTATFTLTASPTGGGALNYQWTDNGSNVGTNSPSYSKTAALPDDGHVIACTVTESGGTNDGTTTSANATLYVGIRWVGTGGPAYSAANGATVAVPYPSGAQAGDKLILIVGQKPSTANGGTCTTPSGAHRDAELTGANDGDTGGYTTTLGADTGNANAYSFDIDATGTESGTLSVAVGTNNVAWGVMHLLRAPSGTTWSVASTSGKRTSAPNGSVSVAMSADPGVTAGDFVIATMVVPTDVNGGTTWSGEAVTQTGVTYSTAIETDEPFSSNGNDIGGFVCYARADSGTSSGVPTVAATKGGTTTNARGPILFLRLRADAAGGGGGGPVMMGQLPQARFPTSFATPNGFFANPAQFTRLGISSPLVPLARGRDLAPSAQTVVASLALCVEALSGATAATASPLELVAGSSASRSEPLESLSGRASSNSLAVEALTGIAATRLSPVESLAGLARTSASPIEANAALLAARVLPVESRAGLVATKQLAVESLLSGSATTSSRIESLAGLTVVRTALFEALQGVKAFYALPFESGAVGVVVATAALPIESLGAVVASGLLPIEGIAALTSSRLLPLGARAGLVSARAVNIEALAAAQAARVATIEALAGGRSSLALPIESTAAGLVVASAALPIESLAGLAALRGVPFESAAASSATRQLALESLRALTAVASLPMETMALSRASAALPFEVVAAGLVIATRALPIESLAATSASRPLPVSSLATGSAARLALFESLLGRFATKLAPVEALRGVKAFAGVPIETLSPFGILVPARGPIRVISLVDESLRIRVVSVSDESLRILVTSIEDDN